jgi:SAM-dependent methyltransferase
MFEVDGDAYDKLMGRYSRLLAPVFADAAGVVAGQRALDVGCGPGALTAELVRRLGPQHVCAIDPSATFVEACARRNPGVRVLKGEAGRIPFGDDEFDASLAQLVMHFVSDAPAAAREMRRVVRPGGAVAACVWDFAGGMRLIRTFWEAASAIDPDRALGPDDRAFGREGELGRLFEGVGLTQVRTGALDVQVSYEGFDDLWSGFMGGVGPVGVFCASLDRESLDRLREDVRARLGSPTGAFELPARAWYAVGRR